MLYFYSIPNFCGWVCAPSKTKSFQLSSVGSGLGNFFSPTVVYKFLVSQYQWSGSSILQKTGIADGSRLSVVGDRLSSDAESYSSVVDELRIGNKKRLTKNL